MSCKCNKGKLQVGDFPVELRMVRGMTLLVDIYSDYFLMWYISYHQILLTIFCSVTCPDGGHLGGGRPGKDPPCR